MTASCAVLLVGVVLGACAASGLEGSVYRGDDFAFRFEPPSPGWQRLDASDAALAYRHDQHQAAILINGRCGLDGEDVPLQALTQHLFLDFTDREVTVQEVVPFDGREAMHTRLSAKLDGVPMRYDVWVLKKDGCVYDLLLLAPDEGFEPALPDFEQIVRGFATLTVDDE